MSIYRRRYNQYRWVKLVMGLAYCVGFLVVAATITDSSTSTTRFLEGYGIPILLWQVIYAISGVANLLIGVFNKRWNMLWFSAWIMYVGSATVGYINGSGIPVIPLTMYWVLLVSMVVDAAKDFQWRGK